MFLWELSQSSCGSCEGSKQCSFKKDEVVALRYRTPVELLTKFIWGNTSSGNHSGQLVPVFDHPPSKEGWGLYGGFGVFFPLMLKRSVLYFAFCPFSLILPQCTTEKCLSQSSLPPPTIPFSAYTHWKISPDLSLLEATQGQRPQPLLACHTLQFSDHLLAVWGTRSSMSLLYWGAHRRAQYAKCSCTSTWQREIITSLYLLAALFLMQPRVLKSTLLPHVQLVVQQVSCFFSAELLSKQSAPHLLD